MPEPRLNREDYKELKESSSKNLKFTEHLHELRYRIIFSLISILFFFLVSFYFSANIIKFFQAAAPEASSFFQLKPGELFMVTLKISAYTGLILSLPVILNQIAIFISPALNEKERKVFISLFWGSPILFYLGICFSYYFLLPLVLDFLLGFRTGLVESRYGLEHFINLEISILGVSGIAFQLPIILILLSAFKLIKISDLIRPWRYVLLGAFMISAILTPTPDPFTMSLLAIALLVLYFFTVVFIRFFVLAK